jgi:ATP-dependent helicase/nuclease subunit B
VNFDKSKKMAFQKNSSAVLATLEQIGKLERYVTKTLAGIASELAKGNASVEPFKGKSDSCTFCEMLSICRYENNDAHRKTQPSMRPDKVWDIIDRDNI